MINIIELSHTSYSVCQGTSEICKVNKNDDGLWIIRNNSRIFKGVKYETPTAAFSIISQTYGDSYCIKHMIPESITTRKTLISHLINALSHLSLSEKINFVTAHMDDNDLTKLIKNI